MELGNMFFNNNQNQYYECPEYIIALLRYIDSKLSIMMWNKEQKEYDSPFDNTGNKFKNNTFEVEAFNWNDNICQEYNFKYKDIKISWYKRLGRDTTINKDITFKEAEEMFNSCIKSLNENESEEEHRIFLTKEQALQCLIINDGQVHNFISSGLSLIGADWNIEDVKKLLEEADTIEVGGKSCRSLGHGIAVIKNNEAYFFAADNEKLNLLEKNNEAI